MIKRVLQTVGQKIDGLHEAAYLLAIFAFGSHLLALVRDRLLAHSFGAGTELDVYYAAFRIPDFIFVSIASLVSLFVLIPFLLEHEEKTKGDPNAEGARARARRFLSSIFSGFFITITAISSIAFFIVPQMSAFLFPGLAEGASYTTLIQLTRIMLLSPILLGISNIFAAVTQTERHFFVYALTPLVYNVGIILGILVLYPLFGLSGLAWGVVFGALLHMLIQIPIVIKAQLLPVFVIPHWKEFLVVVSTSLPRTITLALNQLVFLALLYLASFMAEGSISILSFGQNIQGVPLSIIGVSYSVAAFPTLARLFSSGEEKEFFDHMIAAVRHIIFWSMPAAVLFIVLRAQIVRTALGSGAFSWSDTRLTAAVLALFIVSLVAQGLEMLFVRGYYAAGRTRKPFVVKLFTSLFTVGLAVAGVWLFANVPFVQYFIESLLRIENIPGSVVGMLALAYSIGVMVSAWVLWSIFEHDFDISLPRSLYRTLLHSSLSAVSAGSVAYIGLQVLAPFLNQETFIGIFLQGALAGALGSVVGIIVLLLLKNDEIKEVWNSLQHRFGKGIIVGPELEELER